MWKCPNCATENSDWVKKCEKCQYVHPTEKTNPWKVVLTVAIIAAVVGVGLWLSIGFGVGQKPKNDDAETVYVEISDPGMEKAIRTTLKKPEGPLTEEEVADMRLLNAENCGIKSLDDLAKMPRLQQLYLGGNDLTDVSQVAQLTELIYLNIDENKVTDLSFLPSLTGLMELSANNNLLTDISPLEGQDNILRLYLNNNQITDISAVESLWKLINVWMSGNDIQDLSPMLGKQYLKEFYYNDQFYAGQQADRMIEETMK